MDEAKILVIEDNREIAELVRNILELEGYDVEIACDGKEGLAKVTSELPHLVILDVLLPGIDGWEVLFQIKENPLYSHLSVIMLTGKTDDISKLFGLKHGADDYVTKPFYAPELAARVEAVLRRVSRVHLQAGKTVSNKIPVQKGKKTLLLSLNDIFYINAKYNSVFVFTEDAEFLTQFTLTELEKRLKDKLFVRTHRSYIANLNKIKEIVRLPKAEILLVLGDKTGSKVPVSRSRKNGVKKVLGV